MQRTLDSYHSGVEIAQVQMNGAAPPQDVIAAFQDVIKAGQDQITKRNEAERYRNEKVPVARGDAAAMIQNAEAYREQVVREADGEAQRFSAVLAEYRKAPAVTRQRLYLETMERVYGGADKIIVDAHGTGVQPYLPLDQLRRPAQTPAPSPDAETPELSPPAQPAGQ
jgi:membrane protease subunit HflK